jgi:hypothetical protein
MTSSASHMLLTPKATLRAEHQTGEDSAERAGERPGEGAGGLRQQLLQDAVPDAGPSRQFFRQHAGARAENACWLA